MDITVIIAGATLILILQAVILAQVFRIGDKVSKTEGQYQTHLKGCDDRFKKIEERLDKTGV